VYRYRKPTNIPSADQFLSAKMAGKCRFCEQVLKIGGSRPAIVELPLRAFNFYNRCWDNREFRSGHAFQGDN
jgi:hypothetical protein